MSTRDYSSGQERYIAKITGGKLTPNSGGTKFSGGDILTEHFLIEAKTTTKETKSVSIKKEWLDKAKKQAFEQGKEGSFLAFNFEPNGENYYVMNEYWFLKVLPNLSLDCIYRTIEEALQ